MKTLPATTRIAFVRDVERLHEEGIVLSMEVPLPVAVAVLGQLQLALRHPQNTGPSADVVLDFARELCKLLSKTPAMKRVCEAGFDTEYDVMR